MAAYGNSGGGSGGSGTGGTAGSTGTSSGPNDSSSRAPTDEEMALLQDELDLVSGPQSYTGDRSGLSLEQSAYTSTAPGIVGSLAVPQDDCSSLLREWINMTPDERKRELDDTAVNAASDSWKTGNIVWDSLLGGRWRTYCNTQASYEAFKAVRLGAVNIYTGTTLSPLTKFEQMVHETFPIPEIVRTDFIMSAGPDEEIEAIEVKVKVSFDFSDDEWFWADFIKYFKLKVYMVPQIQHESNSNNRNLMQYPLFDDRIGRDGKSFWTDLHPIGFSNDEGPSFDPQKGYPVSSLENYSIGGDDDGPSPPKKDLGTYIFNGVTQISTTEVSSGVFVNNLANTEGAIVARTFFDVAQFSKDMLGDNTVNVSNFSPLSTLNNGRWDLITFKTKNNWVTRADKLTALMTDGSKWNGAFNTNAGIGESFILATSDSGRNSQAPIITFNRELLRSSNWQDLAFANAFAIKEAARIAAVQKRFDDAAEAEAKAIAAAQAAQDAAAAAWNQQLAAIAKAETARLKKQLDDIVKAGDKWETRPLAEAFSNAYIAKRPNGEVSVSFSFDYLEVAKNLSGMGAKVFNKIEKASQLYLAGTSPTQSLIWNLNVIDKTAAALTAGLYRYTVDIGITDRTLEIVMALSTEYDTILQSIISFLDEARKFTWLEEYQMSFPNADTTLGGYLYEFENIGDGNGKGSAMMSALGDYISLLENFNVLDFINISNLSVSRRRVKSDYDDITVFDQQVPDVEIINVSESKTKPGFDNIKDTASTQGGNLFTDFTSKENLSLILADFFGGGLDQIKQLFDLSSGNWPLYTTLGNIQLHLEKQQKELLDLLSPNESQAATMNDLSNFKSGQTINYSNEIIVLQREAQYTVDTYDAKVEKDASWPSPVAENISIPWNQVGELDYIVDAQGDPMPGGGEGGIAKKADLFVYYLHGYKLDSKNKPIMKSPIFKPMVDMMSYVQSDAGSAKLKETILSKDGEVLCKYKADGSLPVPMADEYFVKKVDI